MANYKLIDQYAPIIGNLTRSELAGDASLESKLEIASEGGLRTLYTPFEHQTLGARIIIVGITPGRTQWLNAVRALRKSLDDGATNEQALCTAKITGAFSGAMRANLVAMLDEVGLQNRLGINSCDLMFSRFSNLLHSTSLIANATFVNGTNYNGSPNPLRTPFIYRQICEGFAREVAAMPDALILPLGEKVDAVLDHLVQQGLIKGSKIVRGMLHPSPASNERIHYFLGRKDAALLSIKTNASKIDSLKRLLVKQVAALPKLATAV